MNIDNLKEKLLQNKQPEKILYEWVKTGRVNFQEFKELNDWIQRKG